MVENQRLSIGNYAVDWQKQLASASFIERRDIKTGTESVVYQREDLNFVVKEFTDDQAVNGYRVAAELLPDLVAPFQFLVEQPISVRYRKHVIHQGVVQVRTRPLDQALVQMVQQRNVEGIVDFIRKKAVVDQEILRRGVYTPDPGYANYGFDGTNEVKLIDPGGAVTEFPDFRKYLGYIEGRGKVHYSHYLGLKELGEHFRLQFEGRTLTEVYRGATSLTFGTYISSLRQYMTGLGEKGATKDDVMLLEFSRVGQEEFEKFTSKVPWTWSELIQVLMSQ